MQALTLARIQSHVKFNKHQKNTIIKNTLHITRNAIEYFQSIDMGINWRFH